MKGATRTLALLLGAGIFSSCAADRPSRVNCPEVAPLASRTGWEFGVARYRATQKRDTVTVTAEGENPTAGFRVQLALSPGRSQTPRLAFHRQRPEGMAAQVITPFTTCVTFKSGARLRELLVRDASGEHRIPVER